MAWGLFAKAAAGAAGRAMASPGTRVARRSITARAGAKVGRAVGKFISRKKKLAHEKPFDKVWTAAKEGTSKTVKPKVTAKGLARSLTPVSIAGSELRGHAKEGAKKVAPRIVDPTGKHAKQEKRNQKPLTKAEVAAHTRKIKARKKKNGKKK